MFDEYGVEAVFSGHYHRNSYGEYNDIKMITTGPVGKPLGSDPSGFRIVMEAINTHTLTLGLVPYRYGYVDASNLLTLWLPNGRHAWHNDRFEFLVRQANRLVG